MTGDRILGSVGQAMHNIAHVYYSWRTYFGVRQLLEVYNAACEKCMSVNPIVRDKSSDNEIDVDDHLNAAN